ncbi:MAG: DNA gyrase inhibitor YacG [Gammaproteobacteria bacterium]
MKQSDTIVHCPTCGQVVAWNQKQQWRPFCSERCKLIDLGEWLDEKNRIPGEPALSSDSSDHE